MENNYTFVSIHTRNNNNYLSITIKRCYTLTMSFCTWREFDTIFLDCQCMKKSKAAQKSLETQRVRKKQEGKKEKLQLTRWSRMNIESSVEMVPANMKKTEDVHESLDEHMHRMRFTLNAVESV